MGSCITTCIKDNNNQYNRTMSELDRLACIDPKTVPKVPFQNEIIYARIEDIYDGDTVKIIVLFGDIPVRFSLRILGIDTPEMRQGDGRLPEERQAAIRVRDYIRSLFPKNIARICIRDWDKFGGRVLGDLYLENGQSISDILIDEGWARPYHGDKKKAWTFAELTADPFKPLTL
jgi:endonuclease YncB( thermonuclease family)